MGLCYPGKAQPYHLLQLIVVLVNFKDDAKGTYYNHKQRSRQPSGFQDPAGKLRKRTGGTGGVWKYRDCHLSQSLYLYLVPDRMRLRVHEHSFDAEDRC